MIQKYTKAIASLLGGTLLVAGIQLGLYQMQEISRLESELEITQQRITFTQTERNSYRKQLIENGNPEGWRIEYDNLTGEKYYERDNGDGIGSCWKEYLH